ncbi:MAG TPA: cytochrome c biogenesis protein CcsA [Anaeromyxobacter sp.]
MEARKNPGGSQGIVRKSTIPIRTLVPYAAAVLALAAAATPLLPRTEVRGFDLDGFSRLAVLEGGRVKPIDSVARNALLVIRGTQSFPDGSGRTIGAREWLLDVLFRPEVADRQPVFQIDDPEVLGLIGLPQTSQRRFPFTALLPYVQEIERQEQAARQVESALRTRFQSAIVNLYDRAFLYFRLKNSLQVSGSPGLLIEVASAAQPGAAQRHQALAGLAWFRPIAPSPGQGPEAWKSIGESLRRAGQGDVNPALVPWGRLAVAWHEQDAASFNRAVADLGAIATGAAERAPDIRRVGQEVLFNRAEPFYVGIIIYVLAFLFVAASWLWWPDVLRPAGFGFFVAGTLVHTVGLGARIFLQGRPPVTNLYSSAVFVGWVAIIVGVVLERMYRRGFATAVSAAIGVVTLIIAHHLSTDGDTMEMMRAVLDSNFWLGTHVITITIGYAGTFLAGAIAIAWTFREHLVPRLDPSTGKMLSSMVYGVICFALFFSFLGTVLGGIWADQSWGRFWGWDPKENGALLIVLWNAIILHARWGGFVRERGIMAMAIFGNVITSLSWFGVNMLGVGLHSYGFMDKAFWALSAFIASQLVLMGLALLPRRPSKAGAVAAEASRAG